MKKHTTTNAQPVQRVGHDRRARQRPRLGPEGAMSTTTEKRNTPKEDRSGHVLFVQGKRLYDARRIQHGDRQIARNGKPIIKVLDSRKFRNYSSSRPSEEVTPHHHDCRSQNGRGSDQKRAVTTTEKRKHENKDRLHNVRQEEQLSTFARQDDFVYRKTRR
jgi:hypothetical protein